MQIDSTIFLCDRSSRFSSPEAKPCDEAFRVNTPMSYYHWAVKLSSIEELINFVKRYNKVIIDFDEGYNTLEIYDTYRE